MRPNKNLLYVALFLLPFTVFAQNTITLNTTGKPPLNTPELTGFMDIVAKEAFKDIGYTLHTVKLPAERGLKNANSGIEDGEMSRIKGLTKIYKNLIQVPEKIMDWNFTAFSPKPKDLSNGWSSLSNYSIAFINGWKILENNVPNKNEITKVKNEKQLFLMLQKNRADLILYERWGGLLYTKQNNLNNIKIQSPPLATKEMFIYLHKKHKNIVPKLAEALKQMKASGRYKAIYNKILSPLQ